MVGDSRPKGNRSRGYAIASTFGTSRKFAAGNLDNSTPFALETVQLARLILFFSRGVTVCQPDGLPPSSQVIASTLEDEEAGEKVTFTTPPPALAAEVGCRTPF
jgi:hypothetical protein